MNTRLKTHRSSDEWNPPSDDSSTRMRQPAASNYEESYYKNSPSSGPIPMSSPPRSDNDAWRQAQTTLPPPPSSDVIPLGSAFGKGYIDSVPICAGDIQASNRSRLAKELPVQTPRYQGPPVDHSWIFPVIDIDFSTRIVERAHQVKHDLDEKRLALGHATTQVESIRDALRSSLSALDEEYERRRAAILDEFQCQEDALTKDIEHLTHSIQRLEKSVEPF